MKAAICLHNYLKELQQPHLMLGPTHVHTDASVVVDGLYCRCVSREMKWLCLNYTIIRQAISDGSVTIVKCASEDNTAGQLNQASYRQGLYSLTANSTGDPCHSQTAATLTSPTRTPRHSTPEPTHYRKARCAIKH
jgi:hypothetical protein